jgi:hypothetical protein
MSSRGSAFPEKESGRQCRATNLRERRQDWTAIAMTGEVSKRRSDELAELRDRYNQLCTALTLSAGANSAAAERVLQELQALAQMIAARQGEPDAGGSSPKAAASAERQPAIETQRRAGNVVAFRFKLKGGGAENPRLPAALNVLTGLRSPADAPETVDWSGSLGRIAGSSHAKPAPPAAAVDPALHAAVAGQGAEIERLARSNDNQRQLLERLEQRLRMSGAAPDVAGDMAALRSAAAHHGQQIVSLATAVHRLAKLLAANTVLGR